MNLDTLKNAPVSRRTVLGATAAAAAGLGLAACSDDSSSTGSSDATSSKELSLYVVSSLATLDPQNDANSDDADITGLLGEGLFRYDSDGITLVPGMAESYTISDDGFTYTFTLRDGMVWQDGEEVTADQFVYGYQRIFDPATASENAATGYIANSDEVYNAEVDVSELAVSAPDDKTVVVTFGAALPEAAAVGFLSGSAMYPMREDMIEEGGDGWSVDPEYHLSNGPYMLESYSPDENVVLVRNEAYTGDAPAEADRITFQLYADASAAEVAMNNGEVDFYKYASDTVIEEVGDDGVVENSEMYGTGLFLMNNASEGLSDVNVREAIYRAIDADYANETLEYGRANIAKGFVGDIYTDPTGEVFREVGGDLIPDFSDEELEAAREALVAAGYAEDGSDVPSFTFITMASTKGTNIAEFYQALLSDNLGISITVDQYDVPTYVSMLSSGDFDLAFANMSFTQDNPLEVLQSFVTGNNYGVSIDEYDELIEQATTESDPEVQSSLLHEAEEVLLTGNYAVRPVTYSYATNLMATDIDGYVITGAGNVLFNYMSKTSW